MWTTAVEKFLCSLHISTKQIGALYSTKIGKNTHPNKAYWNEDVITFKLVSRPPNHWVCRHRQAFVWRVHRRIAANHPIMHVTDWWCFESHSLLFSHLLYPPTRGISRFAWAPKKRFGILNASLHCLLCHRKNARPRQDYDDDGDDDGDDDHDHGHGEEPPLMERANGIMDTLEAVHAQETEAYAVRGPELLVLSVLKCGPDGETNGEPGTGRVPSLFANHGFQVSSRFE